MLIVSYPLLGIIFIIKAVTMLKVKRNGLMLKPENMQSITDHSEGIYNYFRGEECLNFHRSYDYLVNPAVGYVIADWWEEHK